MYSSTPSTAKHADNAATVHLNGSPKYKKLLLIDPRCKSKVLPQVTEFIILRYDNSPRKTSALSLNSNTHHTKQPLPVRDSQCPKGSAHENITSTLSVPRKNLFITTADLTSPSSLRKVILSDDPASMLHPLVVQATGGGSADVEMSDPDVERLIKSRCLFTVFGWPCIQNRNVPCTTANCMVPDYIVPARHIRPIIRHWPLDFLQFVYDNFVMLHRVAYTTYFSIFCNEYGDRKQLQQMRLMLKNVVEFSSGSGGGSFLRDVFVNFLKCGVPARAALQEILANINYCLPLWDEFVDLIVDGNMLESFVDVLYRFSQNRAYRFKDPSMARLILMANDLQIAHVTDIVQSIAEQHLADKI